MLNDVQVLQKSWQYQEDCTGHDVLEYEELEQWVRNGFRINAGGLMTRSKQYLFEMMQLQAMLVLSMFATGV